jgi:DNA polymerase-4
MPTATALRLCPEAVVLPVRMSHYATISRQIREIFFRYTPLVEPLSLDEAFLDVTGSTALFGPAGQIASRIKDEINRETGLVASVGIAPNKFLAKIASDLDKPDGFVCVAADGIQAFLDPLPLGRLWGVGKVTSRAFTRLGISTIGQLRRLPRPLLLEQFGERGDHFWKLARGIDPRAVVPEREAKSISHETTFRTDIEDVETLESWVAQLTDQVAMRLRQKQLRGRTVHVKIRFADFHTITRCRTLPRHSDVTREIWQAARELLRSGWPASPVGVRLLGVGVSGFGGSGAEQRLLFDEGGGEDRSKQRQLDRVTDEIRQRFGAGAVNRGSGGLHRRADRGSS